MMKKLIKSRILISASYISKGCLPKIKNIVKMRAGMQLQNPLLVTQEPRSRLVSEICWEVQEGLEISNAVCINTKSPQTGIF